MPNPYVLLAGIVFTLGLFGAGISIGYKWSERSHLNDVVTAQNAAIAGANAAAALEIERTVAAAKAEADARVTARTARLKGELDNAKKSRPGCARDAESMGLLNDALRVANGEKSTASSVPSVVRNPAAPAGWIGAISEKLGVPSVGTVRSVSPTPR